MLKLNGKEYYTPKEVVERWQGRVTYGCMKNWRNIGRGPAFIKVGGRVYYELSEIEDYEKTFGYRGKKLTLSHSMDEIKTLIRLNADNDVEYDDDFVRMFDGDAELYICAVFATKTKGQILWNTAKTVYREFTYLRDHIAARRKFRRIPKK